LPFLTFGFFAGVRPEGELQKLKWSDIHLDDRKIVIASRNHQEEPQDDLSTFNRMPWNGWQSIAIEVDQWKVQLSSFQVRRFRLAGLL
jgi:hypothetical protein